MGEFRGEKLKESGPTESDHIKEGVLSQAAVSLDAEVGGTSVSYMTETDQFDPEGVVPIAWFVVPSNVSVAGTAKAVRGRLMRPKAKTDFVILLRKVMMGILSLVSGFVHRFSSMY